MVFSTTTLFKGIACPEGDSCLLTNCIYSHNGKNETSPHPQSSIAVPMTNATRQTSQPAEHSVEPTAKRRKVTYDNLADKPPSRADVIRTQLAAVKSLDAQKPDINRVSLTAASKPQPPASLVKPVSPPLQANAKANSAPHVNSSSITDGNKQSHPLGPRKASKPESLNPRLIANDPVGHQKRSLYLKALHTEMARLNKTLKEAKGIDFRHALHCSDQEITTLALDFEEKIGRDQPAVYPNIVKQQVTVFRKMAPIDWAGFVKPRMFQEQPKPVKKEEKIISTGLPLEQEYLILSQLVIDQKPLAAFGYVPTPPTEKEAAEAASAVEASANYEICDRCSARFQVFPERNEEGQLSSNGPCKYHPYRKTFPQRAKTDKETGVKEPYFPCCNEPVGTPGCIRSEEHVFKASSPGRLAAVMQFITTPYNPLPATDRSGQEVKAVTFDCEMGYTAYGMELIRLTAVTWPKGEELLDILVRPLGSVIDFNSRFSGVFPEHFKNAIPYDDWNKSPPPPPPEHGEQPLPIVDSPERARELLCSFLKPTTPLMGHAIDNDLNTVRLCHPTIIDTVILFAHPRGLPMRFGLKMLSHRHLHRAIQQGGDRGHDSKEDAVATGDLVRIKVGEKWRTLRASGWQILNDQLIPPPPPPLKPSAVDAQEASMEKATQDLVNRSLAGMKRKKRRSSLGDMDGAGDSETGESSEEASG